MAKQNSYQASGVDYSKMDPIKILAQKAAKATGKNLKYFGHQEMIASRGESAYVWEEDDAYRSLVIEGLGTKNLVADAVRKYSGKTHYDTIAQDTIAMIVNDLIVVGAMPQVVNAYFAVGDSNWLSDEERAHDLITGWAKACDDIGATWGGGETPTLKGIVNPETIDLGGSAIGIIKPKANLVLGDKLSAGDAIILVESSGVHANGISLVRKIANDLPEGYQTKLSDGTTFGEAVLTPTHLYVDLIRKLFDAGIEINYMMNITGHGWRKLMRASKEFSYVINEVPPVQPVFNFIQQQTANDDAEMYGNYNMGAGFAIYVPAKFSAKVVEIADTVGFKAWNAGKVQAGPRKIEIKSKGIVLEGDSLKVR